MVRGRRAKVRRPLRWRSLVLAIDLMGRMRCHRCERLRSVGAFYRQRNGIQWHVCRECKAKDAAAWRAANPDEAKAASHRHRTLMTAEQRTRERDRNREWRRLNADENRAHQRRWREANPEKMQAARDAWRAVPENAQRYRDYKRALRAADPSIGATAHEKRRARVAASPEPAFTAADVLANLEAEGLSPDHAAAGVLEAVEWVLQDVQRRTHVYG